MIPDERLVLIIHQKEEEGHAVSLSKRLQAAGFTPHHLGLVLVGESFEAETLKVLDLSPPVVLCGTTRAVGAKWCRRLVHAARDRALKLLIVQMESDADVEALAYGEKVAEYWKDPDRATDGLVTALRAFYPGRDTDKAIAGADKNRVGS